MLDFRDIRSGVGGQREAFEEFVCQIAHRMPPSTGLQFRRIHGAGGDGGIEAYWLFPDGSKHGFQAKFYTRSSDINWAAIDDSVEAALIAHPTLTKYYVAVACDLTDIVPKRRGKSGWEHWQEHEKSWVARAKGLGIKVDFVAWTASGIEGFLTRKGMEGLRDYWFGQLQFSQDWLTRQFDRTVSGLEERYHPEDNVEVEARHCFEGLTRNALWRETLNDALTKIVEKRNIGGSSADLSAKTKKILASVNASALALDASRPDIDRSPSDPFDRERWVEDCKALNNLAYKAQQSLYVDQERVKKAAQKKGNPKSPFNRPGDNFYPMLRDISEFRSAVNALQNLLDSDQVLCDATRFCILEGRAGSGKSHLLAAEVQNCLNLGVPCLFLLGTNFSNTSSPERDFLKYLDLTQHSFAALLGALSAAAEQSGHRALIVIDAVNEGAGIGLWRSHLSVFACSILAIPNLALCISCRSEYAKSLITERASSLARVVTVRGFETEQERESAAKIYMDRRGIVRPGTPWLNPEFTNPLFLRTACLALERTKRREFPKGLRGTKELLRFFLDATADSMGVSQDGTGLLTRPVAKSMLALAGEMAKLRQDFLSIPTASQIVDQAFGGFAAPAGGSWLDTLKHNGLLRYDPDPLFRSDDPLDCPQDVMRFSFQRFQDHLMAEALLSGIAQPTDVFAPLGLDFTLGKYGVEWAWRGLFVAASIQIPEKFKCELVDLMPGGVDRWWDDYTVQDCFVESVRWRSVDAFSDRSLELLNLLQRHDRDMIALLIELSVTQGHPWNARLLHSNLLRRKLAPRDAFWTLAVNEAHDDPSHPANTLTDWALGPGPALAEPETISLALTTLSWLCTSTSRNVRDRATKAITALLVNAPNQFPTLIERFDGVDDLYVMERILAGAFGACCLDPSPSRLRTFSEAIYRVVFEQGSPPVHLLLRDYARAIIELAASWNALNSVVDQDKCKPPHHSAKPRMTLTRERTQARAEKLGAESITSSCFRGLGDFGRYVIEGRVHDFSNAPLSGPAPLTVEQLSANCRRDLVQDRPWVELAFLHVEQAYRRKGGQYDAVRGRFVIPQLNHERIQEAERTLNAVLSKSDYRRYQNECKPHLLGSSTWKTWHLPGSKTATEFDAEACKLWVANRAISMGWTKKLFPYDATRGEDRARNTKVERIGKKYQWLAFFELLGRLADNYWLAPGYEGPARSYDTPLDVSFTRDIDPTILPDRPFTRGRELALPQVPNLVIPDLDPPEMQPWIEDSDLPTEKLGLALCPDLQMTDWVTLYRYASCDIDAKDRKSVIETPWKQCEFHFISCFAIKPSERKRLIEFAPRSKMDFHEWLPHDYTDGPYLGELGLRDTWKPDFWEVRDTRTDRREEFELGNLAVGYQWESHLDGSLPDGASVHLPHPWLLQNLGINSSPVHPGIYIDHTNEPVVITGREEKNSYCLVRRDKLIAALDAQNLKLIWTLIGERMAWWDGDKVRGKRVRFNGMLWLEGRRERTAAWSQFD